MPFLSHILRHRNVDLTHFVPVYVDHEQIGWTKRDFAKLLGGFDFCWIFADDRLTLHPALEGFEKISQTVHDVFLEMSTQSHLPLKPDYSTLGGEDWLPVGQERWTNPLFQIARFYSPTLGIRRESVILHGYEDDKMWLAVRGNGVEDDVGRYDTIVSGCMTIGETYNMALMKEGREECGLTEEAAKHVKRGSQLHTMYHLPSGFIMDEIFHSFDLNTKNVFEPKVVKAMEVSHFELHSIQDIVEIVEKTSRVKPQIAYLLIDFFIRHGYLKSDTPSYQQIVQELTTPYQIAA